MKVPRNEVFLQRSETMLETQVQRGNVADSAREWAENAENHLALRQRNGDTTADAVRGVNDSAKRAVSPGSASNLAVQGQRAMTKPPATPSQMLQSKLVNRRPILCAVCDCYISPFTGLPVILDAKERIIEFVHPGCCVEQHADAHRDDPNSS
jgi:hypothetical protein